MGTAQTPDVQTPGAGNRQVTARSLPGTAFDNRLGNAATRCCIDGLWRHVTDCRSRLRNTRGAPAIGPSFFLGNGKRRRPPCRPPCDRPHSGSLILDLSAVPLLRGLIELRATSGEGSSANQLTWAIGGAESGAATGLLTDLREVSVPLAGKSRNLILHALLPLWRSPKMRPSIYHLPKPPQAAFAAISLAPPTFHRRPAVAPLPRFPSPMARLRPEHSVTPWTLRKQNAPCRLMSPGSGFPVISSIPLLKTATQAPDLPSAPAFRASRPTPALERSRRAQPTRSSLAPTGFALRMRERRPSRRLSISTNHSE